MNPTARAILAAYALAVTVAAGALWHQNAALRTQLFFSGYTWRPCPAEGPCKDFSILRPTKWPVKSERRVWPGSLSDTATFKASTRVVTVPWTAPVPTPQWAGCVPAMPACYYYVYRSASLTSGSVVSCPVAGGPSYALLNGANPAVASPYVDRRAPKASVCYYARTVQGGRTSTPSNAKLYKGK